MTVAYIALFLWIIAVLVFFSKYPTSIAVIVSIIGGFLLLPTKAAIDLPLLPVLDKNTIPALACLAAILAVKPTTAPGPTKHAWMTHSKLANLFLGLLIIGPFLTVFSNQDWIVFPQRALPGLTPYDGFSTVLSGMMMLLPFILGYRYLNRPEHHKTLLVALVIAALLYSVPTLYEIRMSPQLNVMIYGFFPHSFAQHIRGNGFRPLVFLTHGLYLSLFLTMAFLAAGACIRLFPAKKSQLILATGYLFVVMVLSKSLGALMIAIVVIPMILLIKTRTQLLLAAACAAVIVTYPTLRGAHLVPVERIVSFAESVNPARAESFQVRLRNEEALLDKANQKPFLGWGGYNRNRIYNAQGHNISIADGTWIIAIGTGGWLRYLGMFGLLAGSVFLLAMRSKRQNFGLETSMLALILVANLIDLIPNSGLTPVTWMIAGALWGRLGIQADLLINPVEQVQHNIGRYSRGPLQPVTDMPKAAEPASTRGLPYTRQKTRRT